MMRYGDHLSQHIAYTIFLHFELEQSFQLYAKHDIINRSQFRIYFFIFGFGADIFRMKRVQLSNDRCLFSNENCI